jgi:hypothetical protein
MDGAPRAGRAGVASRPTRECDAVGKCDAVVLTSTTAACVALDAGTFYYQREM